MSIAESNAPRPDNVLSLASEIVAAYVSKNAVPAGEVSALLKSIHGALNGLSQAAGAPETSAKPAVPVKKSVTAEYVICLEDGKKLKMLKRYLRTRYNLTPEEYRHKWGLATDYPMVAPNYAAKRSEFAKKIGLGRTRPAIKKRKKA